MSSETHLNTNRDIEPSSKPSQNEQIQSMFQDQENDDQKDK